MTIEANRRIDHIKVLSLDHHDGIEPHWLCLCRGCKTKYVYAHSKLKNWEHEHRKGQPFVACSECMATRKKSEREARKMLSPRSSVVNARGSIPMRKARVIDCQVCCDTPHRRVMASGKHGPCWKCRKPYVALPPIHAVARIGSGMAQAMVGVCSEYWARSEAG